MIVKRMLNNSFKIPVNNNNEIMGTVVKSEPRHDDREINEMAKRIIEQNRAKAAHQSGIPGYPGQGMHMARPGQPGMPPYYQHNRLPNAGASTSTQGKLYLIVC